LLTEASLLFYAFSEFASCACLNRARLVQLVGRVAHFFLQAAVFVTGPIAPADPEVWEGPHRRRVPLD
jgi:hypothetical protein